MRLLLPAVLLACRIPPADVPDPAPVLTPPALSEVTWSCDEERSRWTLEARATSWTAGGTLWLTDDGRYVEQHEVPSIAAAADGSEDRLRVRLDIEADWRQVSPGRSTAFLCSTPPDGLFLIVDPDGEEADCAAIGPGRAWEGLEGLPDC